MKTLLLLLLPILAIGQNLDHIKPYKLNEKDILYYDLIFVDSTQTKKQLFDKSMQWIAKAFKDSKEVERYDNIETGEIVAKGSVTVSSVSWLTFDVNIIVKDGRARIVIDKIIDYFDNIVLKTPISKTPLENSYFKNGDISKPRTKFNGVKEDMYSKIIAICEMWQESLKSKGYSDF